jgi:hydrogenase nickel incorporation protein HypB
MCDSCGCDHTHNERETRVIDVNQRLLQANDEAALSNKKHFDERGILAINLISSPGSGKTTLLEKTIEAVNNDITIGVLEGDIETELDAERIRAQGAPAVQLTTGGACHLESALIHKGIHALEKEMNGNKPDILFIENVGNLVCPSFFDLGEHIRVALISVPEGHDKPVKYPKAIKTSQLLVITKSDLLPYFDFDTEKIKKDARAMNPSLKIFVTSATSGEGMEEWINFLQAELNIKKSP